MTRVLASLESPLTMIIIIITFIISIIIIIITIIKTIIVISNIFANVIVYIIFIDIIIIITLICSMPKSFFWKPFVHIFGEGRNMEQEQRPLSKPRRRPGFHRDRRWTEFYQERDSEVQWYILSYWLRKKSWQLDLGEWKTTKFQAMDKKLV